MGRNNIRLLSLLCQAVLISSGIATDHQVKLPPYWTTNITSQLATLPLKSNTGGQDFTRCCASALSALSNGSDHTDIWVDPFSTTSQYPCGATYQGDSAGAPAVHLTYRWCHEQCPGWQVSKPEKLTQWLQPFVGFILPAVIFSLNVPRRRKIQPPAWVFPKDIEKFTSILNALWCILNAALIVTIDTIFWLCAVFALAGPLLLSGLYEAWIDKRVVDYMSDKSKFNNLPFALRSRILIAVLVGNLDLDIAWMSAMDIAQPLERRAVHSNPTPAQLQIQQRETADAITDIQKRISSMLACQYSFGSTIGAPVVFYIGSFIYALLEIRAQLGDNDTSHALAFGMWWMTIPHIAIVSGCLLAGNNPNTLEAIVPLPSGPSIGNEDRREPQLGRQSTTNGANAITGTGPDAHEQLTRQHTERGWLMRKLPTFGPTYDAQYQPQWMINRGRSKREWLFCLIEVHERRELDLSQDALEQLYGLQARLDVELGDWSTLIVFALLLFMIPCMFGFLVAYLTPQVGVSCRSFTVLMYATSQIGLLLLWLWNVTWRDEKWRKRRSAWSAKVYPEVISPTVASQPQAAGTAIQNQGVQPEPTTTDLQSHRVNNNDAAPNAETNSQHGVSADDIQMIPMPPRAPLPTGPSAIIVQPERNDNARTTDEEAAVATARHASDAGTAIPQGKVSRMMSFLAKATWIGPNDRGSALSRMGTVLYRALMGVLLLLAILSAIGGTVMQIVGVYRTCLCQINVNNWISGRNAAGLIISNNTAQDIRLAHDTWIPIGYVAAGFLGITAYIAWWYQRRLRFRFALLLGNSELGVFNNQMGKQRRSRRSAAASVAARNNGAGTDANHPATNKIANGGANSVINGDVNGIANGSVNGITNGDVNGINGRHSRSAV